MGPSKPLAKLTLPDLELDPKRRTEYFKFCKELFSSSSGTRSRRKGFIIILLIYGVIVLKNLFFFGQITVSQLITEALGPPHFDSSSSSESSPTSPHFDPGTPKPSPTLQIPSFVGDDKLGAFPADYARALAVCADLLGTDAFRLERKVRAIEKILVLPVVW